MIHLSEIWYIIQRRMPRGRLVPLEEIYQIVKRYGNLDAEDFKPQSPTSDIPKWKRNVRNVLYYRNNKTKEIQWDGDARHLLL